MIKKKVKSNSWWYFLERYIHVSIKSQDLLLYNTLTGKHLEYKNQAEVVRFVKRLQSAGKMQVIKLTRGYLDTRPAIARFVKATRKYYMADLVDTSYSEGKPIQMLPILNIQRDIKKLKADPQRSVGEELMKTLDEVTLYIHSRVTPHLKNNYLYLFKKAYKQFIFNYTDDRLPEELDIRHIRQLAEEIFGSNLTYINIAGGDIFRYKRLKELLEILSQFHAVINFYIPFTDIIPNISAIQFLHTLNIACQLVVLIPFPIDHEAIECPVSALKKIGIPSRLEMVVQSDDHLEASEKLSEAFEMRNFSIRPFFNGRNLGFLKKHAFLTKTDILNSKPGIQDIYMRTAVNPANFGKLTILTDGRVYANVNAPFIGKLGKVSIYRMIAKEMESGRSWRRVRSKVQPCKNCLYNQLCPPLLNYEYVLNRNDLCFAAEAREDARN